MATTPTTSQLTVKSGIAVADITVPAVASLTTDTIYTCFTAPFAGAISAVSFRPLSNLSGVATNNRTFSLYNNTGTAEIAELTTAAGVNLLAGDFIGAYA